MITKLQNSESKRFLSLAIAFLIVSFVFLGMTLQEAMVQKKTPIALNNMTLADCSNYVRVSGDLSATIGYYWESYKTTNGVKQSSSTERIYLIPFGTQGQYIGLNVKIHEFDQMEELRAKIKAGEATESIGTIDGYLKKCDKRMIKELKRACEEDGTVNYEDVFVPYYIERASSADGFLVAIGFVFMLIAIIFIVVFVVRFNTEMNQRGGMIPLGQIIFDREQYNAREEV